MSPSSSFNCIDDLPKPPLSVWTRPLKSSISNFTNNLLPPLNSYLPMPPSKIDHQYIPTDPLYLSQQQPKWLYHLGEDILRMGSGTQCIRIMAWDLTLTYIALHQATTLLHYSQPLPLDGVIDLETCNVLMRYIRVGRAARFLGKEIILLFQACTPQWWQWQWWWNIWRVCQKVLRLSTGLNLWGFPCFNSLFVAWILIQ